MKDWWICLFLKIISHLKDSLKLEEQRENIALMQNQPGRNEPS